MSVGITPENITLSEPVKPVELTREIKLLEPVEPIEQTPENFKILQYKINVLTKKIKNEREYITGLEELLKKGRIDIPKNVSNMRHGYQKDLQSKTDTFTQIIKNELTKENYGNAYAHAIELEELLTQHLQVVPKSLSNTIIRLETYHKDNINLYQTRKKEFQNVISRAKQHARERTSSKLGGGSKYKTRCKRRVRSIRNRRR